MLILLITTLPNKIHNYLQRKEDANLKVVDCSQFVLQKEKGREFGEIKSSVLLAIRSILEKNDMDIIITYRCPFILPPDIFNHTAKGSYNIHPSLLPKYPGLNPWKGIYNNKERESGVTLHVIDEGVDTGTIVLQRKFDMNLDENIQWHQQLVEDYACQMLDDILFTLDNSNLDSPIDIVINKQGDNIDTVSAIARRNMIAGLICEKLEKHDESVKYYEKARVIFTQIADYNDSIEDYKKALSTYVFILLICKKAYGQKHENTASCYEHAAELQAKMGMEESAMSSQRMANEIRERIYGFSHERYIRGLQKSGEIGFLIGEYKRRNGKV